MPQRAVHTRTVKFITFQLPLRLYIEYTMKLMIIVWDWEMGIELRALGYRECIFDTKGL